MGMPGPQQIKRYGVAFKLKAVQMSRAPGYLNSPAAMKLMAVAVVVGGVFALFDQHV